MMCIKIKACASSRFLTSLIKSASLMSKATFGAAVRSVAAKRAMSQVSILSQGTIPGDAKAKPHHVTSNGRITGFKNPHPSFARHINGWTWFSEVRWPQMLGRIPHPDTKPPTVPVRTPEFLPTRRNPTSAIRATWLGHACYLVELPSGLRVLFDPVFEPCCGPYGFLGPPRYTPAPCALSDIPIVDAVIISHNHYDHLSSKSCWELQKRNPNVHFFAGLGLKSWFTGKGIKNMTEMDWWQDAEIVVSVNEGQAGADNSISATISCLPCQHGSGRGPRDADATLWCSWSVKSEEKNVWFGGDTGYRGVPHLPPSKDDYDMSDAELAKLPVCPQFAQIGELRGPFDLGMIPIGAYKPRGTFSSVHANPFDSVEIFRDTRCKKAMGIHWGTWELTVEEVLEPVALLREALKRRELTEDDFGVCDIGESREF